jgi:hypothetical protein
VNRAFRIIRRHELVPRKELGCIFVMVGNVSGETATVDVREKHNAKCGGDLVTAPRRFSLEINLRTGAAKWDNNVPDMEMPPIPPASQRR